MSYDVHFTDSSQKEGNHNRDLREPTAQNRCSQVAADPLFTAFSTTHFFFLTDQRPHKVRLMHLRITDHEREIPMKRLSGGRELQ